MNKKKYTVYFEIFGKKMKAYVLAESREHAKRIIRDKIIFHKVSIDENEEYNKSVDAFDNLKNLFGI